MFNYLKIFKAKDTTLSWTDHSLYASKSTFQR